MSQTTTGVQAQTLHRVLPASSNDSTATRLSSAGMLGVRRLRLPQPVTGAPVIELAVANAAGQWMYRGGWRGFTLPLPFVTVIFYWLSDAHERPDPYVRVHEFVHARQHHRFTLFGLRYLLALLTDGGYRRNRFEVEAYRIEAEARRSGLPAWAVRAGDA